MIVIYIMAFSNDERYGKIKKNWSIRIQVSKLKLEKGSTTISLKESTLKLIITFLEKVGIFIKNYSLSL